MAKDLGIASYALPANINTPQNPDQVFIFKNKEDDLYYAKLPNGDIELIGGGGDTPFIIGNINCSTDPDYPATDQGKAWRVSVAGKIGGALGVEVGVSDIIYCLVTNNGGTQAEVGDDFTIWDGDDFEILQRGSYGDNNFVQQNTAAPNSNNGTNSGVFGSGNTINAGLNPNNGSNNIICGLDNTIDVSGGTGDRNFVSGNNNTLTDTGTGSHDNSISGDGNILTNITNSRVSGVENQIVLGFYNDVSGFQNVLDNTVGGTMTANRVSGRENALTGGSFNALESNDVNGESNTVTAQNDPSSNNKVSGFGNIVDGASNAYVSGLEASIVGVERNTYRVLASGMFAAEGDSQIMEAVAKVSTTDATPAVMTINGNGFAIPNGYAWKMIADIVACNTAGAGIIARQVALVINAGGTVTVVPSGDENGETLNTLTTATAVIQANGGGTDVEIEVTGEAGVNLFWTAHVKIVQTVLGGAA